MQAVKRGFLAADYAGEIAFGDQVHMVDFCKAALNFAVLVIKRGQRKVQHDDGIVWTTHLFEQPLEMAIKFGGRRGPQQVIPADFQEHQRNGDLCDGNFFLRRGGLRSVEGQIVDDDTVVARQERGPGIASLGEFLGTERIADDDKPGPVAGQSGWRELIGQLPHCRADGATDARGDRRSPPLGKPLFSWDDGHDPGEKAQRPDRIGPQWQGRGRHDDLKNSQHKEQTACGSRKLAPSAGQGEQARQ